MFSCRSCSLAALSPPLPPPHPHTHPLPTRFDPGATTTVTGIEPLPNGRFREWILSRDSWRNQTGADRRLAQARLWMRDLENNPAYQASRLLSPKTSDLDEYIAWATLDTQTARMVLMNKLRPCWQNASFRSFQLRSSVINSFWARVKRGNLEDGTCGLPVFIAYGDARFPSSQRGRPAGPTNACYKSCVDTIGARSVFLVDEHRTTKTCACCGERLQVVWHDHPSVFEAERAAARAEASRLTALHFGTAPPPRRELPVWRECHGLRRCLTTGRFVSRDGNAAVGILRRLLCEMVGLGVPEHLQCGVTRDEELPPPFYLRRKHPHSTI